MIAGFGDQREVELLVEAGFTPVEAIHIATSNGAEFLGELDKIGTLAVGKTADIVVVQGDPSANIKDIEKVELVFKDGVGYDSAQINRLRERNGRLALERKLHNSSRERHRFRTKEEGFFPSALGKASPTSCASVGATSRMSIVPSDLPAGTPGPTRKKDARRSGRSGIAPCVPPALILESTGPSLVDPFATLA